MSVMPSKRILALEMLAGQDFSTILKRFAAAVAPLPPENAVVATVPRLTGCAIAEVSTTQAVPVMLPVKLITPSAAFAA